MILQPHCGFYKYEDLAFATREDLLSHLISIPQIDYNKIKYDFNDDVFEKMNWRVEPDISLDQLYVFRAKQLRAKYDYLILSYSGGSDSNEVLETFMNNGIFIDEIQTTNFEKMISKIPESELLQDDNLAIHLEYRKSVIKTFQKVKKLSPQTKLTTLDISDLYYDQVMKNKFDFMGLYDVQKTHSVKLKKALKFSAWSLHMENQKSDFYQNRKTAFIRGVEKPILSIKDRNLIFRFSDFTVQGVKMIRTGVMDNIYTIEDFFWSRDMPYIPIKQCHVIKNYMEHNPELYHALSNFNQEIKTLYTKNHKQHIRDRIERRYASIIYKYAHNIEFVATKPWDNQELLLLNKHENNNFDNVVKEKVKVVDQTFSRIENQFLLSRNFFTKNYNIGEIKL